MVAYIYYVLAAIALVIGVIAAIRILAGLGYGLPMRIVMVGLLVVPLINLIDLGVLIGLASKRR
jgi:ABC-type multidrug transport system permease subunit